MKKKMIILIAVIMIILIAGSYSVFTTSSASSIGVAMLKSSSVYLNENKLEISTLHYNNTIYVPLIDICNVFSLEIKYEKGKYINLIPSGNKKKITSKKHALRGNNKTVGIYNNDVSIRFEGINSYLESIKYNSTIFVPLVYFAEEYNRNVEWDQHAGVIKIQDNLQKHIGMVNSEFLTEQELNYFYIPSIKMLENIKYTDNNNKKIDLELKRKEAINIIVERKIINQKLKEYNLKLNSGDAAAFNSKLDEIVKLNKGINAIRDVASEYSSTFSQMARVFKEDFMRDKFKELLFTDIKITDEQISKYYQENPNISLRPKRVRIKQIMLKNAYNEDGSVDISAKDEKKKKIEGILKQIESGEDFNIVMEKNTEDPNYTKHPEGYIIDYNSTTDKLGKAAFSLNVGQISEVVESFSGLHILKLEEIIPEEKLSVNEASAYIRRRLENTEIEKRWNELLEKWKDDSEIVIK
ncbi:MAG TPA: peptidyl-prolyl cis-trans isomerase [Bacilli bacterium]